MGENLFEEEFTIEALFERLAQSAFRSKFKLSVKDKAYIRRKGIAAIRSHAADFVAKHLTPMRGHPVFLAPHATSCCCRGRFAKWHHRPTGRTLTAEEQQYAVSVLMEWIQRHL